MTLMKGYVCEITQWKQLLTSMILMGREIDLVTPIISFPSLHLIWVPYLTYQYGTKLKPFALILIWSFPLFFHVGDNHFLISSWYWPLLAQLGISWSCKMWLVNEWFSSCTMLFCLCFPFRLLFETPQKVCCPCLTSLKFVLVIFVCFCWKWLVAVQ